MWFIGKIKTILGQSTKFRTKEDVQKWIDSLDESNMESNHE